MNKTLTSHPLAALPALLDAWNRHEDLRTSGAPISELANSRSTLDRLRLAVR